MTQNFNIITKSLQPNFELDDDDLVGGTYSFIRSKKTGTVYISDVKFFPNRNELTRVFVGSVMGVKKENLYVKALRNLYKKVDFLELNQALESKQISDSDFDKELTDHEDKYLIPYPEEKPDVLQVIMVSDIVKKIGRVKDMTVDEASELFQLDLSSAENVLAETDALTF